MADSNKLRASDAQWAEDPPTDDPRTELLRALQRGVEQNAENLTRVAGQLGDTTGTLAEGLRVLTLTVSALGDRVLELEMKAGLNR